MSIKKFWSTVIDQLETAFRPIPGKLSLYYKFWSSRKFSPEINAKLEQICAVLGKQAQKALLDSIKFAYETYGKEYVEEKIKSIDINKDRIDKIIKNLHNFE